jgi:hypothetical protein
MRLALLAAALLVPFVFAQGDQLVFANKHKHDPLQKAHKILRKHNLIDTHNDLPMYVLYSILMHVLHFPYSSF